MTPRALAAIAALLFAVSAALVAQDKPDALVLFNNGDYRAAVTVCQEELKAMPYNGDSFTVLGWSLLRLGEYQEALKQAQLGLSRLPADARITEIAGEALYYLGRVEEALRFLEEYASLSPTGGRIERAYALMGECFIQLREYNNADIAFSMALHLKENDDSWWARLGYVREMAKDYRWSLDAYGNALRLNPANPDAQRGKKRVEDLLKTQ
jgi:tetratricopeptide (TPR) repeat protein